jgi:very-short-patch-repair endonuclease
MVLHHAADPPAVLAEIRRVLSHDGLLLIADLARHERETAREQLADQWLGFDETELTGWLKHAGFGAITCERIEGTQGQEAVLVVTAATPQLTTPQPPPQRGGGDTPDGQYVDWAAEMSSPPGSGGAKSLSGAKSSPPSLGGAGGGIKHIHNTPDMKPLRKSLRNGSTPAERELWNVLKQSNLGGYKFRRQQSIGRYIVDFYCPSSRLAIELDGESHFTDEAMAYDQERTNFLTTQNIRVLRFLNTDVHQNLDAVCERILEELGTTP